MPAPESLDDAGGTSGSRPALSLVLDRAAGGTPPVAALVVGFDRRPESEAALRVAADMGRRLRARLRVVHAIDLADYPIDPDEVEWEDQARRALASERQTVAEVLADYPESWSYQVWRSSPTHAIIWAADQVDALMIVVGKRGEGWRTVLDRLVSPSVSHRLINRCGRPVLVVCHVRDH